MAVMSPQSFATRIDQLIAVLVVGNLGWVTWHLGGFLIEGMAVAYPVMLLTLVLVVLRWSVIDPTGWPVMWWLPLPMLVWVIIHVSGLAEVPGRAMLHGLHVGWGAGAFWVGLQMGRCRAARPILGYGVCGIILTAVGIAVYQRVGDSSWLPLDREQSKYFLGRSSGPFGSPNNFAAWLAVLLPLVLAGITTRKRLSRGLRWMPGLVAGLTILGILLTLSRGVGLAMIVVGMTWLITRHEIAWSRRLSAFLGLLFLGFFVGWGAYQISPEVRQRWDSFVENGGERTRPHMWHIAHELWQGRPWTGNGGGSFGALLEIHRPEGLWETPEYAHSDYLETLNDYGIVGGLLSFGVVLAVIYWGLQRQRRSRGECAEKDEWIRAIPWGLAVMGLAIGIDFHLQSPSIFFVVGGLGGIWLGGMELHKISSRDFFTFNRRTRIVAVSLLGLALAIGLTSLWLVPVYTAESLRFWARERINDLPKPSVPEDLHRESAVAEAFLDRATKLNPENDRAWSDLSYAISLQGYKNPEGSRALGERAEIAARRALAGSEMVAEYWIRLGVALDLQGRWGEAGLAFGRAVNLAPRQPVVWYYQGFHLSLKPMMHEMAKAALATCLRLDPWYDEAKLLKAALEGSP